MSAQQCERLHHLSHSLAYLIHSRDLFLFFALTPPPRRYPDSEWYVPTRDLVNIFAAMNATCDTEGRTGYCPLTKPRFITECSLGFYAGSWAISKLGAIIFPFISHTMGGALTGSGYVDNSIGGVDDDAAWTSFMVARWADWVTTGPPPRDELREVLNRRVEDPGFPAKKQWIGAVKQLLDSREHPFYYEEREGGGYVGVRDLTLEDAKFLKELSGSIVRDFIDVVDNNLLGERRGELVLAMEEEIDKIVGASPPDAPSKDSYVASVQPLYAGSTQHEHLGASFSLPTPASACPILIGSPGYSTPGHPQSGKAAVHNCDGSLTALRSAVDKEPVYERFGAATVMKGDLAVVCAPSYGGENVEAVVGDYRGRCDVFTGVLGGDGSVSPHYSLEGGEWEVFGSSVVIDGDSIIVAAPKSGSEGDATSNAGAVYVYDVGESEPRRVLRGDDRFQHFGSHVVMHEGLVVVGSEVWHADWDEKYAVGRIQAFDEEGAVVWEVRGSSHASSVGSMFEISDGGRLAISVLGFNHTNVEQEHVVTGLNQLRSGKVVVVDVKGLEGVVTMEELEGREGVVVLEPHDAYGVVESKIKFFREARFGAMVEWVGEDSLVVGAPGANEGTGAMFRWNSGVKKLDIVDGMMGKWSRFGETFQVLVGGKVLVAARRASLGKVAPDEEQFGAIVEIEF